MRQWAGKGVLPQYESERGEGVGLVLGLGLGVGTGLTRGNDDGGALIAGAFWPGDPALTFFITILAFGFTLEAAEGKPDSEMPCALRSF